jgi:ureidoacrylate peracid hydrolase
MEQRIEELLVTLQQKASPSVAAVVVIDVQNDFVADGGFFHNVGADVKSIQQRVIPKLERFIHCARETGVLVVFIQAIYDAEHLSEPMRERNLRTDRDVLRCLTGTWGAEFYGVKPNSDEPVVIKHRYSGVINTDLVRVLKSHGVKSLLLTGVATDTCVESTGRDAYFIDYYVTMVSDCCGAASGGDHLGALKRFERDYGSVVSSDEIIATWQTSAVSRTQT